MRQHGARDLEIWPSNREALTLFLACATQWRRDVVAGVGIVWQGMDYNAAAIVARARRVKLAATLLSKLQVMETAALGELNKALGK